MGGASESPHPATVETGRLVPSSSRVPTALATVGGRDVVWAKSRRSLLKPSAGPLAEGRKTSRLQPRAGGEHRVVGRSVGTRL